MRRSNSTLNDANSVIRELVSSLKNEHAILLEETGDAGNEAGQLGDTRQRVDACIYSGSVAKYRCPRAKRI